MFKEISKYLIFGFLTTVISFCSFTLMSEVVHTGVTISNVISWILAVLFAFVTNKTIVFQNKDKESKKQVVLFFSVRAVSLVIETILLLLLIEIVSYNKLISTGITQIVVIVLNYIASKFIVFK